MKGTGSCCDKTRGNGFKLKGEIQVGCKKCFTVKQKGKFGSFLDKNNLNTVLMGTEVNYCNEQKETDFSLFLTGL